MARNGSGTYSNPYPDFISGTVISSTEVDANNSDIATALTQSIAVDGQAVVTGDIPLATHKFTAMKVGTASTDSLSLGQAQAEAFVWCGTAGGGADAITLSPSPAITAYAAGQRFVWMASGSTNTGATTVAISGLTAIALQDNGAALTAGQHAASKMFMGILNTTSTVQIMQVQISGTDPLIISSLTVSGTSLLTGVTTHGDDVVSDTDSTDDLGTTSVRWANLFVDGITATDQITATGFTGTLDGILGSGAAAAATVTTIDASGDVTLSASGGAAITGLASINTGQIGGSRNFIYNGDFQIFQRSNSVSGLGNGDTGYHVHDRWQYGESGAPNAVVTWTGDTETPDGFNSSMKLACTTASGTVAVGDVVYIAQIFEGYDLQSWAKGSSSAKAVTLSFWVRSTKTGTYIVSLHDNDNNRHISKAYTVSSTDTWEYKTLTFAGDTSTGDPFGNDNATSLYVQWPLVAGANYTSGTLATSWAEWVAANSYVGQVDALDSTSNYFYMTGVQLELGSTATAFQYEHYNANLLRCRRYYIQRAAADSQLYSSSTTGGLNYSNWDFAVPMRAAPTMTGSTGTQQQINIDSAGVFNSSGSYAYWTDGSTASAELS
jgi:hypothetical protein